MDRVVPANGGIAKSMPADEHTTTEFARPVDPTEQIPIVPTEEIPVVPEWQEPGSRGGRNGGHVNGGQVTNGQVSGHEDGSWRGPAIVGAAVLIAAAFGLSVGRSAGGLPQAWRVPSAPAAPFISASPAAPSPGGPLSGPVLTNLSAAGVDTVDIDGISGQVTITAAPDNVIGDVGSNGSLLYKLDSSTHTLRLYCSSGSCPADDYIVTIPEHVGLTLRQVSGQTTLTDLSGPVDITAASTSMSAAGLDTNSFTASITSGQLNATFNSVPRQVAITVVSAQATVHLPGDAQYAVTQHVTSGNVGVEIPQNPNARDTVDATVVSGQITLDGE
jgi:hypothetical protein